MVVAAPSGGNGSGAGSGGAGSGGTVAGRTAPLSNAGAGALASGGGPMSTALGVAGGSAVAEKASQAIQGRYFNPIGAQTAGNVQSLLQNPAVQGGIASTKIGLLQSLLNKK